MCVLMMCVRVVLVCVCVVIFLVCVADFDNFGDEDHGYPSIRLYTHTKFFQQGHRTGEKVG